MTTSDQFASTFWLDLVDIRFPLIWSSTGRVFTSEPRVFNPRVFRTEMQLKHLSPDKIHVDFGAQWDQLPRISLSNIALKLAEESKALKAVANATSDSVANSVVKGINAADNLLDDQIDKLFEEVFEEEIRGVISDLGAPLRNEIAMIEEDGREAFTRAKVEAKLGKVRDILKGKEKVTGKVEEWIGDWQKSLLGLIAKVETRNGEIVALNGRLTDPATIAAGADGEVVEGLLYLATRAADAGADTRNEAQQELVAALFEVFAEDLAGALGSAVIGPAAELLVDVLREDLDQLFAEVREPLGYVTDTLVDLYNRLEDTKDLITGAIDSVWDASIGQIDAAIDRAIDDIVAELSRYRVEDTSEDDFITLVKNAIRDRFRASAFIGEFQVALRHKVFDVHAAVKEAIDSGFQQVNHVIFDIIKKDLDNQDEHLAALTGKLDQYVGAGKITGHAHINNDKLEKLRLDAKILFKLPDDFEFEGYFEFRQFDSEGTDSCTFDANGNSYGAEVIIGAPNVPMKWISEDATCGIESKLTFGDSGDGFELQGISGGIKTNGEFDFEAVTIKELSAGLAIGSAECYFATSVGLKFNSYELDGGVFFGTACSVAPLEMIDPDVGSALGNLSRYTGVYAFGGVHMPIFDAGCLFNISAGAEIGIFAFTEGPTIGGKVKLSADGEALCIIDVGGELVLVGGKDGTGFFFEGKGKIRGKVGPCPFCKKFKKTVTFDYRNGRWTYDY